MRRLDGSCGAARIVSALLMVVALAAAGLGTTACDPRDRANRSVAESQSVTPTSKPAVHERPIPPISTAPLASATAEDAMRAWYLAWFAGDMDAARRTSTELFAGTIAEHTFEGGDVTDYKILGTEGAMGKTAFLISETREDVPEKTPMTVLVAGTDDAGGYLVDGYDDTPEGTVPASPAPPDSVSAVGKTAAQDAVTGALQALQNDQVSDAKALATARFSKANPGWFSPASGALTQFSIGSAARRHDVWVVQTTEQWRSETFHSTYVVDTVDGKAVIDRVKGWY